jgi:hypothetical protein
MRHRSDLIDDRCDTFGGHTEPEQLQLLEDFLSRPQHERTARRLLSILDQFAASAARDARADEDQGYLGDVLVDKPESSREVEGLRCDDDAGNVRLDELREHARRQAPDACVPEELLRQLSGWLATLAAHRHEENRLINESLTRDTGGES